MKIMDNNFLDKVEAVIHLELDSSQRQALIGNVTEYQEFLKQAHPVKAQVVRILRALLANAPTIYKEDLSDEMYTISLKWTATLNSAGIQTKVIHSKDFWRHTDDIK